MNVESTIFVPEQKIKNICNQKDKKCNEIFADILFFLNASVKFKKKVPTIIYPRNIHLKGWIIILPTTRVSIMFKQSITI